MSLLRRGHQLILALTRQSSIRCFQTAPVIMNAGQTQDGFIGLENCFVWDEKHGFGFDKNGQVVIVTPKTSSVTSQTFSSNMLSNGPESENLSELEYETPKLEERLEYESDNDFDDYPTCTGGRA